MAFKQLSIVLVIAVMAGLVMDIATVRGGASSGMAALP